MPIEDIKVTPIEKNNIKTKATIPLNPTAQGWSGEQVRNRILQGSVGETDSVLSLLESKMDIVHNFIANIYDGDIDSVLIFDTYETMVASTPKTNILYLVKTPTALYYYDSEFKELYSVDTYTKDETYNQTEIDAFNLLKANASEVFSKEETYNRDTINDLVADVPNKANIVILQSITTQPATATVGQIYYNAYDKKIYLYDGSDWGVNNVGANGILYMFNNVLYVYNSVDKLIKIGQKPTNFDSLIVDSLHNSGAATFDNEVGIRELTVSGATIFQSGLSTNGNKIVNVATGVDNNDAVNVKQLADVIAGDLSEHYKKVETYSRDEIIDLIASNYKAKGNLAPAGLVAGLLVKANLGNVYNITGQFTTTINFLEGAGIIHEAGENVAIVEYSAGVYKFDVLSSFVDLSGYVEKTTKVAGYDLQDDITVEEMETALGLINYVLKDGDKVLSTEDYTSEEKTKLGIALVNTLKIAGITVDDDISVEDLKAALVLVKGDVGLGNVENYDIATKVLAELGESNIKYMTPLRTKEAIDYNLIPVNTRIDTIADLSPYHYQGTFLANDTMQSLLRPLEAGGGDDTFVTSKLKGAMFVCETAGAFDFSNQYTWSEEVGAGSTRVDTIIYNFLPPYQDDSLLPSTNFKIKDVITIVNFQFGGLSPRTITLTMQVEKNPAETFVLKNETITGATKTKITYDAKGLVTAGADLIADDIPALAITKITNLSTTLSDIDSDITALQSTVAGIEDLLEAI